MKSFKIISIFILVTFLFSSCSSAQKLQKKAPIKLGDVYCQSWVAGIKGGGSGLNLFIPTQTTDLNHTKLDSVYFRGKSVKLEAIENKTIVYVGRFENDFNQKKDIIMSSDPNEEYGNEIPKIMPKIPFELKENECVVSFQDGGETKYFKIENVTEKATQNYPGAPLKKQ